MFNKFLAFIDIPFNLSKIRGIMPKDHGFYLAIHGDDGSRMMRKMAWQMFLSNTRRNDVDWHEKAVEAMTDVLIGQDFRTSGLTLFYLPMAVGYTVCDEHKWFVAERFGYDVWKDVGWLRENVVYWDRLQNRIGKAVARLSWDVPAFERLCHEGHGARLVDFLTDFHDDCPNTAAAMHWLQNEFLKRRAVDQGNAVPGPAQSAHHQTIVDNPGHRP